MSKKFSIEETRLVKLPLEVVWGLVSDTNRLNRYIGLFPVNYTPFTNKAQQLIRKAKGKAYGLLEVEWDENVFEWVRDSFYTVERNYTKGPVERVIWKVSVVKVDEQETNLTLTGWFEYRSLLGKVSLKKGIIPQLLQTFSYVEDAATTKEQMPTSKEQKAIRVEEHVLVDAEHHLKGIALEQNLVHALIKTIRTESDEAVTSIQPYRWAFQHGFTRQQAVRLFLFASEAGILDYEWSLMCPNCRVAKDHASVLKDVKKTVHCDLCGVDFELDFENYVEMTFQVNGAIRKTNKATYCINGPTNSAHTIGQFRIAPRSTTHIPWTSIPKPMQVRVIKHNFKVPFTYQPNMESSKIHIQPNGIVEQLLMQSSDISIVNASDEEYIVAFEETKWDEYALTAREVTSLQLFRDLLPAEVLAPGMQIGVGKLTILFTDLKDSTQLYERVGDASAYSDVQKHFTTLGNIIRSHDGTIVKTIGDSIMAAFSSNIHALDAAHEIQSSVSSLNEMLNNPVTIKVGLHEGPVIAVNANGVLDYFGRTVNMAARVQQQSTGGDIVLKKKLFDEMGYIADLGKITEFTTQLHGMTSPIQLVRLEPLLESLD
ncbi:adenylate/guanylate cyclase domain-containing protein [Sporosarcina sp. BI001-red]|uniref:adenylate/guanylate cyclase domain-containing protein n=1 Tax=Sporosarcina sp. BI001-red TaxID=2282866 RepID=UPI0013143334|nr:adenylate/guanylate cyclase domain-containing protein [Sporosarcina sp. BI001-red]